MVKKEVRSILNLSILKNKIDQEVKTHTHTHTHSRLLTQGSQRRQCMTLHALLDYLISVGDYGA